MIPPVCKGDLKNNFCSHMNRNVSTEIACTGTQALGNASMEDASEGRALSVHFTLL